MLVQWGWSGPRVQVSRKFTDDADAVDSQTTRWGASFQIIQLNYLWTFRWKKQLSILESKGNVGTMSHQESSSLKSGVFVAKRTLIKTFNKPKIFPSALKHYGFGSKTTLGRCHLLADTGSSMDCGYIIYYTNTTKQGLHNTPPCENGPALHRSIFLTWTGVHSLSLPVSELSPRVKTICYRHDVGAIATV